MTIYEGIFNDRALWNGKEKTAVSVRDGVLEYLGAEIGQLPADKLFTVYRSPATIANAASKMAGIPITLDHVDVGIDVEDSLGSVISGEMIDHIDEATDSKLAIKNKVTLADESVTQGKELSLGYKGELVPHAKYDFEQRNIEPHHLAIVQAGRCGASCTFIDKKPEVLEMPELLAVFKDQEGAPNLQQIVEIAQSLPEALKALPVDELQKVIPTLQEVVAKSGMVGEEAQQEEAEPVADQEPKEQEMEAKDADEVEADEVEKVELKDSAEFKDALAKAKDEAVKQFASVVSKAKDFVDEAYSFEDKTAEQVMRDAIASEYGKQKFADEELPVVFKMLRKSDSSKHSFGDHQAQSKFQSLENKEL